MIKHTEVHWLATFETDGHYSELNDSRAFSNSVILNTLIRKMSFLTLQLG